MRTVFPILFIITLIGCSSGNVSVSDLRDGDLLFVVNGHGNNITNVTEGVDGLGIDHVAIFSQGNIIEAVPEYGVVESPLDSFMVRLSDGESVLVGRIDGLDVEASLANARNYLAKPYDDIFMPSDSAIYCSELVQKSFVFKGGRNDRGDVKDNAGKKGKAGEEYEMDGVTNGTENNDECNEGIKPSEIGSRHFVFNSIPMSFHDSTGNVTEFWTKFYAARGLKVPEGEPGTNPGQLSRDPNVKLQGYLRFGAPALRHFDKLSDRMVVFTIGH